METSSGVDILPLQLKGVDRGIATTKRKSETSVYHVCQSRGAETNP